MVNIHCRILNIDRKHSSHRIEESSAKTRNLEYSNQESTLTRNAGKKNRQEE